MAIRAGHAHATELPLGVDRPDVAAHSLMFTDTCLRATEGSGGFAVHIVMQVEAF